MNESWLPNCLVLGIDYDHFWHMNPRKIKPFADAYKLHRKVQDEQAWMMGRYTYEAVLTAVDNVLAGNKSKLTYRDKPISQEIEEQHMSEEQKIIETQKLFHNLELMQDKFEKAHPKSDSNSE